MQRDPYEEALDEFESGSPDRAALARATVNAAGNPDRLKAEYIRIRAKDAQSGHSAWGQLSDAEKEQRAEDIFLVVKSIVKYALILFVVLGTVAMVLVAVGAL